MQWYYKHHENSERQRSRKTALKELSKMQKDEIVLRKFLQVLIYGNMSLV